MLELAKNLGLQLAEEIHPVAQMLKVFVDNAGAGAEALLPARQREKQVPAQTVASYSADRSQQQRDISRTPVKAPLQGRRKPGAGFLGQQGLNIDNLGLRGRCEGEDAAGGDGDDEE